MVKVYEGEKPYIFISYAHANAPAVMQVLDALSSRGFRIWYDDGIEVGSEWQEYIAGHLASASLMIAFLSNAYMRSDNCRKEMHFALAKGIPVINVFLEETQMTPGMEMQIGNLFALMKHTMSDEVFYEKLFAAPQLTDNLSESGKGAAGKARVRTYKPVPVDVQEEAKKKKKRKIRRAARLSLFSAVLIAAVVLGLVGWFTGLIPRLLNRREQVHLSPVDESAVIVWTDAVLEQAARAYSGIAEGDLTAADLTGLRELTVCGSRYCFEAPAPGDWYEAGTEGGINDLSDLRHFPDLAVVELDSQPLSSLESFPACGIEALTVRNCGLTGLSGIENLPLLRELEVSSCPLRDLSGLDHCLQLRRLCVPGEGIRSFAAVKPLTKLAEIEISGSALNTLKPLFRISSLTDVALKDCDLRGRFFYAFDRERAIVTLHLENCKLNSTKNLDDFTGLTTLTLIGTGGNLDWRALAALPSLQTVTAGEEEFPKLQTVLEGSGVELLPAK